MAKPAAKQDQHSGALFDAVLQLGDLAKQSPVPLRDAISLGIRLTPDGEALDEITWLLSKPSQVARASVCARRDPLLETIRQQLIHWFANPAFVFSIPLAPPRTPFQAKLRTALCSTHSGDTLTYGELAQALQSAPRAVGQALGSNPLPIIVPCHRIVSAGKNRLTGFDHARSGPKLALKAWLLEREVNA